MDASEKVRAFKAEIDQMTAAEREVRARLQDLRRLADEKAKRTTSLKELQAEEAKLLAELGLK